jgi:ascorbate-specific PTS system EIIC-type component UlaA
VVKGPAQRKIELPDNFKFLQDTYLAMAVVMVPMYLIPAVAAGRVSRSALTT